MSITAANCPSPASEGEQRVRLRCVLGKAVGQNRFSGLSQPHVGDRRPACARWRRHPPPHHHQLGFVARCAALRMTGAG
jgi:hypothetical protein